MSFSRRAFIKAASAAAAAAAIQRIPAGSPFGRYAGALPYASGPGSGAHVGDPDLRALASAALDAARAAGASYADVRFTLTRIEDLRFVATQYWYEVQNDEFAEVGVRALVNGAWGFAAGPLWVVDDVARLGREAAGQGRENSRGGARRVELAALPAPATGTWKTPIRRDPFDASRAEKIEVAYAMNELAERANPGSAASASASSILRWARQERVFASSEGAFISQTLYRADPSYAVGVRTPRGNGSRSSDLLLPMGGGFEVASEADLGGEVPRLIEDARLIAEAERVVPSRYEVIFDARATAQILARTVGVAAELDRALGYEANAGGTSYLAPPTEMLGSFHLGSELLGVRTNRSRVGGYSTARWDDEGVPPEDYPVVEKGTLVDYHTTRELAPALAEWYAKRGAPVRSHGCSGSADAGGVAIAVPPDLELLPGKARHSLADLVAGLERGLVICGGRVYADRQQLNGEVDGEMVYEVRNGKRTRCVSYAEALFRAPELWKNLVALGGEGSGIWTSASIWKGQPAQEVSFGVGAVPARFRGVAVTDIMRKA